MASCRQQQQGIPTVHQWPLKTADPQAVLCCVPQSQHIQSRGLRLAAEPGRPDKAASPPARSLIRPCQRFVGSPTLTTMPKKRHAGEPHGTTLHAQAEQLYEQRLAQSACSTSRTGPSTTTATSSSGTSSKGPWLRSEDETLIELVNEYGTKQWSVVAMSLEGKSGKQVSHELDNPNPSWNPVLC
jgi:hypothetical protein